VSFSLTTNSAAWTTKNDNQNTINDNDAIVLLTSADPPINNNATLCPGNVGLLSMVFPQHSLMVTHFQEYATRKGFSPAEQHTKQSFTTKEFSYIFSGESNHFWDRIQFKPRHKQEGVIFVALPNLMAVSRVSNVVFLSHIFGMPAIGIS
jgi:hypothetical protein